MRPLFAALILHEVAKSFLPGFWQNGSITNSNFYDMLDIPYAIHGRFQVVRRSDASREIIPRDNQPLGLGEYVIENHGKHHCRLRRL